MYIVLYKHPKYSINVKKFEYLDEAQEFLKELVQEGITDITLSREIPFKLNIDVEFYEEV